jgi:hypothetical protein
MSQFSGAVRLQTSHNTEIIVLHVKTMSPAPVSVANTSALRTIPPMPLDPVEPVYLVLSMSRATCIGIPTNAASVELWVENKWNCRTSNGSIKENPKIMRIF